MTEIADGRPLDFLVIELPAGTRAYPENVAGEVSRLSEAEVIRVVQFAMVSKGRDGALTITDQSDARGADAPATTLDEHLPAEGLAQAVAAVPPGGVLGVLVYESLWATPLASAVRCAGGEWLGRGRLV